MLNILEYLITKDQAINLLKADARCCDMKAPGIPSNLINAIFKKWPDLQKNFDSVCGYYKPE